MLMLYLAQGEQLYRPHKVIKVSGFSVEMHTCIVWSKLPMLEDALKRDRLPDSFQFLQERGRSYNCHNQKPVGPESTI